MTLAEIEALGPRLDRFLRPFLQQLPAGQGVTVKPIALSEAEGA